jgi:hypothetical protein
MYFDPRKKEMIQVIIIAVTRCIEQQHFTAVIVQEIPFNPRIL